MESQDRLTIGATGDAEARGTGLRVGVGDSKVTVYSGDDAWRVNAGTGIAQEEVIRNAARNAYILLVMMEMAPEGKHEGHSSRDKF